MFTHTGPRRGDVFAESSFAKQIAMAEAGLIWTTIHVGNLDSLRTIADVGDAVRAYHMLLTIQPKSGESYNIGGSTTMRIGDILDYLINISTIPEQINIRLTHRDYGPSMLICKCLILENFGNIPVGSLNIPLNKP